MRILDYLRRRWWLALVVVYLVGACFYVWRAALAPSLFAGERTAYYYLLSSVAQSLAAIMALTFTITLVVAQMRTRYGMQLARHAIRGEQVGILVLFIVGTVYPLAVMPFAGPATAITSLLIAGLCMAALVYHLLRMRSELDVTGVLREWQTAAIRRSLWGIVDEMPEVQNIEDACYGALAENDFSTLREASKALAVVLRSEVGHRHRNEIARRLGLLCAHATDCMRGATSAFDGLISGLCTEDGRGEALHADIVADILDDAIASCRWPDHEAVLAGFYESLYKFIRGLVWTSNGAVDFDTLADRVSRQLTDRYDPDGSLSMKPLLGSGRAAFWLFIAFLLAPTKGLYEDTPDDSGKPKRRQPNAIARKPISTSVRWGLQTLEFRGRPTVGRFGPKAYRIAMNLLAQNADLLDQDEVVPALNHLHTESDPSPVHAAEKWLAIARATTVEGQFRLADFALSSFTTHLKSPKVTDVKAGEFLMTFGDAFCEMLEHRDRFSDVLLVAPLQVGLSRYAKRAQECTLVAEVAWRMALNAAKADKAGGVFPLIWKPLRDCAATFVDSAKTDYKEEKKLFLTSLLILGLCHIQVALQSWPNDSERLNMLPEMMRVPRPLYSQYCYVRDEAVKVIERELPQKADWYRKVVTQTMQPA